jgi:hypothetical protein
MDVYFSLGPGGEFAVVTFKGKGAQFQHGFLLFILTGTYIAQLKY